MQKKLLFMLTLLLMSIGVVNAQVEVNENYVQSEQGFVVKRGSFKIGKKKYSYSGLYTPDGKICVKCNYSWEDHTDKKADIAVAPGTEVLGPFAFADFSDRPLYLPKSLKKIYPNATGGTYIDLYDDKYITEHVVIQ